MKKVLYPTLAGIMALAAATNNLAPAAPAIAANAMPAAAPAVTACCLANSMGGTGNYVMTTGYYPSTTTAVTEPVIVFDSWQDVYRDAHFRFASEYSDHSDCVVREVLDDAKIIHIPNYYDNGEYYHRISGGVVGVEYDGTTVRAGEGVRQRELVLNDQISFLTLYDFSADKKAIDNPENYYDFFTSLVSLNRECSIDIPQIDAIVELLHKNGLELTIFGLEGSTAEKYAKKHGLPFKNALKTEGDFTFCMHADHVSVYEWQNGSIDVKIPAEVDGLPVTEIDDHAFLRKESIRTVDIPDTVTYIRNSAFWGCTNLKTVHMPASLREIGKSAFAQTAMTSIVIPDSVTTIGEDAFSESSLESIVIPDTVTTLGKGVFTMCDSLKSAKLPAGLKIIPEDLFASAKHLSDVKIPENVTVIGESAFAACEALTTLTLPEHLTEIGTNAFAGCAFSSIVIPDNVTEIGKEAFSSCISLKSITIPKGVTVLRESMFSDCSALERVELPEGLLSIEEEAFKSSSLQMIEIPDSCTEIGSCAFCRCAYLKSVNLPKNLKKLNYALFDECTVLTDVQLPETLETIEDDVFSQCALNSIVLPDTVKEIGGFAFGHCESLKNIHLSEALENIPRYSFSGCAALESIVIPASVKSVGEYAFEGCQALRSVTVEAKDCVFGEYPLGYDYDTAITIIGHPDSTAQQLAADSVLTFKSLDGSKTVLPDMNRAMTFEIREDGAWLTDLNVSISDLTVPAEVDGHPVVGIAEDAFHGRAVKNLVLPDSITTIEKSALGGTEITSLVLPKNLKTLGANVFVCCTELQSIVIPDGITVIPACAFWQCSSLKEITIPETVTMIEEDAFHYSGLTSVSLPPSVSYVGKDAFAACYYLTSIKIPNGSCECMDFLYQNQISCRNEQGYEVPTIFSEKNSVVHGYADWVGIPFCTLEGTPVTEPSAVKYEPEEETEEEFVCTTIYSNYESIVETTDSAYSFVAGDINQSGSLTIADAVMLARVLAEDSSVTVTEKGIRCADMNGSGTPDQEDLIMILKRLAGIE